MAIEMPGLTYFPSQYRALNDIARDVRALGDSASEYVRNHRAANAASSKEGKYISSTDEKPVLSEEDARLYQQRDEAKSKKEAEKNAPKENPDDYVEFTYVPGDTFGQKILDLGIATDNGLWGENGDVAFYTQQLVDGGYLDGNGNVKLGVPIRLKKRK